MLIFFLLLKHYRDSLDLKLSLHDYYKVIGISHQEKYYYVYFLERNGEKFSCSLKLRKQPTGLFCSSEDDEPLIRFNNNSIEEILSFITEKKIEKPKESFEEQVLPLLYLHLKGGEIGLDLVDIREYIENYEISSALMDKFNYIHDKKKLIQYINEEVLNVYFQKNKPFFNLYPDLSKKLSCETISIVNPWKIKGMKFIEQEKLDVIKSIGSVCINNLKYFKNLETITRLNIYQKIDFSSENFKKLKDINIDCIYMHYNDKQDLEKIKSLSGCSRFQFVYSRKKRKEKE